MENGILFQPKDHVDDPVKFLHSTLHPDCPLAECPGADSFFQMTLKPHQRQIMYMMETFERLDPILINEHYSIQPYYGVIGNKPGSGKSFCVLAHLCRFPNIATLQPEWKERTYFSYSTDQVTVIHRLSSTQMTFIPINVLVVDHGLIHQWTSYLSEYTALSYFVIATKRRIREWYDNQMEDCRSSIHVLLISNTMFPAFSKNDFWKNHECGRLIMDEADSIEIKSGSYINYKSKYFQFNPYPLSPYADPDQYAYNFNSRYTWYLSATYGNLIEPYAINKKRPHLYPFQKIIPSRYVFLRIADEVIDASFSLPSYTTSTIWCHEPITHILSGLVNQDIFSCLCAGNYQEASRLLGYERIVCLKEEEEEKEEEGKKKEDMDHDNEREIIKNPPELLQSICSQSYADLKNIRVQLDSLEQMILSPLVKEQQRLRWKEKEMKILEKMELIRQRLQECTVDPITLAPLEEGKDNIVITKCCQHKFHEESILGIIQHSRSLEPACPMCRHPMTREDLVVMECRPSSVEYHQLQDDHETTTHQGGGRPPKRRLNTQRDKFYNLKVWLEEESSPETKIVIYAQRSETWNGIKSVMQELHRPIRKLMGTSDTIHQIVRQFRQGNLSNLFLDVEHFPAGINLENTDILILFQAFYAHDEQQVIGRCQRPGRTCPLQIIKFRYTTEEDSPTTTTTMTVQVQAS